MRDSNSEQIDFFIIVMPANPPGVVMLRILCTDRVCVLVSITRLHLCSYTEGLLQINKGPKAGRRN